MPKIYGARGLSNASTISQTPLVTDMFGELRVVQKTPVITAQSLYNVSQIREYATTASGGNINGPSTTGSGEYQLRTTTTSGSSAVLQTTQRCSYQSGFSLESGMGVRFTSSFPTNTRARWGFFDGTDGFFWQYDSVNKLSCNVMRAGVITQTVQADFNTDVLDGTGPSGYTLDISKGLIFRITFVFYGYGAINFLIESPDSSFNQQIIPCHQTAGINGQTSITNPSLPVRAELVTTGTASGVGNMYIGGRQASIVGAYAPPRRITSVFSSGGKYSATQTGVIAIRRKAGYLGVPVEIQGIDAVFATNAFVQLCVQSSVNGGTWITPTNTTANETTIEYNSSFTGFTVGIGVWGTMTAGTLTTVAGADLQIPLTENDICLVVVQAMSGIGNQNITGMLVRVLERW